MKKFPISVEEMCERFEKIPSPTIYDTLDLGGFDLPHQILDINIKPLLPHMTIAGPAFTLMGHEEVRTREEMDNKPWFEDYANFRAMFPNCVIVQNPGKNPVTSNYGGMMARASKNQGARGLVNDGNVRDTVKDHLRIPGWSVFTRNHGPIEAYRRWRPREFMVPIAMTGQLVAQVRVNPYDWIVGDWDGVHVIPQEIAYDVLLKAEEIEKVEELTRQDLARGEAIWDVFAKGGRRL